MFKSEISNYKTYLENGRKAKKLMKSSEVLRARYHTLCLGDLSIKPTNLNDLHNVRQALKGYFKTWQDEIVSKWVMGDTFGVKYMNKSIPWVEILLTFSREEVPQELLGDCVIKAQIIPACAERAVYNVVCPMGGAL